MSFDSSLLSPRDSSDSSNNGSKPRLVQHSESAVCLRNDRTLWWYRAQHYTYLPGLSDCLSLILCVDGTVSFFVDAASRDVTLPCVRSDRDYCSRRRASLRRKELNISAPTEPSQNCTFIDQGGRNLAGNRASRASHDSTPDQCFLARFHF